MWVIQCVSEFKLLGITIDNKLNFNAHVTKLCHCINSKLFSIKKIFYLNTSVKVQFFKTFILPYFDYCSTLLIYFNKTVIQKLCNKYYLCISKLLRINFDDLNLTDFKQINDYLMEKFDIPAFQFRICQRLSIFSFKMLNYDSSPKILHDGLLSHFLKLSMVKLNPSALSENVKKLRNRDINIFEHDSTIGKYEMRTFNYFFYAFLSKCLNIDYFNYSLSDFKLYLKNYISNIFVSFSSTFSNFFLTLNTYNFIKSLDWYFSFNFLNPLLIIYLFIIYYLLFIIYYLLFIIYIF